MFRDFIETWLSLKVGVVVVGSPWLIGFLEFINWMDVNKLDFGVWASFLLTVVLIISHFFNIRGKEVKTALEVEEANLRIELLKLELKEKQEESEDGDSTSK